VWVKRSSLAWLTEQARREGKSRSALVRDLLVEAIAARRSR
jgi:Ribbon-helix-helix protein, copG family